MRALVQLSTKYALLALPLLTVAPFAAAYIGPGSGISVIGSLLGLLATILITLGAIALFPIRKMMKKNAGKQAAEDVDTEPSTQPDEPALEPARSEGVESK